MNFLVIYFLISFNNIKVHTIYTRDSFYLIGQIVGQNREAVKKISVVIAKTLKVILSYVTLAFHLT